MQHSRVHFSFALVVVLLASLLTFVPTTVADSYHSAIQSGETLRVGVDARYPPYEFQDENSSLAGFDIALMSAIAEIGGFDIEWVNAPFESLLPSLEGGELDAVISAVTITNSRRETVEFSVPYVAASNSLILRADHDPNQESFLVGVQAGRASALSGDENVEMATYETPAIAIVELLADNLDGVIVDPLYLTHASVFDEMDISNSEFRSQVSIAHFGDNLYGIALQKDAAGLIEAINAALDNLAENGTFAALYEEWFGAVPSEDYVEMIRFAADIDARRFAVQQQVANFLTGGFEVFDEMVAQTAVVGDDLQTMEVPNNPKAQALYQTLLDWVEAQTSYDTPESFLGNISQWGGYIDLFDQQRADLLTDYVITAD